MPRLPTLSSCVALAAAAGPRRGGRGARGRVPPAQELPPEVLEEAEEELNEIRENLGSEGWAEAMIIINVTL